MKRFGDPDEFARRCCSAPRGQLLPRELDGRRRAWRTFGDVAFPHPLAANADWPNASSRRLRARVGDGTLPVEQLQGYVGQDAYFLEAWWLCVSVSQHGTHDLHGFAG